MPGILDGYELTAEEADDLIMRARAHWFEDEDQGGEGEEAPTE